MPTIVRYNNIEIFNCRIREFRQEVVYDESGTDYLYTRFSISVEGIVGAHEHTLGTWLVNEQNGQPVDRNTAQKRLQDIFIALREPRKRLQLLVRAVRVENGNVVIEDRPVLDIHPIDTTERYVVRDFRNGPQPKELRVLSIMGSRLCTIAWQVETSVLQYPTDVHQRASTHEWPHDEVSPLVLSNRWAIDESFDANFQLTRTIRGTLVQSSPFNLSARVARWYCWPPLEPGFRRESARFSYREDGLRLDYEITDRQIKDAAPWPCTTMNVVHRRRVQDGATCIISVQISLTAPPVIPRYMLIRRAVQLANFFLRFRDDRVAARYGYSWIIQNCEIVEEFGQESRVTLNMDVETLPEDVDGNPTDFIRGHLFACGRELTDIDKNADDIPKLPRGHSLPYPFGDELYSPHISWKGDPFGLTAIPHIGYRNPAIFDAFINYLQYPYQAQKSFPTEDLPVGFQARPENGQQDTVSDNIDDDTQQPARPDFPVEVVVYRTSEDFDPYAGLWPDYIFGRYDDAHRYGLYTYTRISDTYVYESARQALRLSDYGGPSHVVISVGPTACYRVLQYDCERHGQMPEIPILQDFVTTVGPSNAPFRISGWLVGRPRIRIYPPALSPTGDGYVYRVKIRAVWALDRAPPPQAPLPVTVRPYLAPPQEQLQYKGLALNFSPRIGPVIG